MSTTMPIETTVGRLVAEQPARSQIFERFGIDYCCGGRKKLADVCQEKGLDAELIALELAALDNIAPAPDIDWTKATLTELSNHIERTHHDYLREVLPRLTMLTEKVANAHGAKDGRLCDLRDIFHSFRAELEAHMWKEENVLFPLLHSMEGAPSLPAFHCGSVTNPIRVMLAEHDDAGDALAAMRSLIDEFTPPTNACNTYRALIAALVELEKDMHQHVHKENNILFPKAIEMETAKDKALPTGSA
jgi:regulator of cell morphogenesis and NO signaling